MPKQTPEERKEQVSAAKKQYYEKHREEILAARKQYAAEHREKIRAYKRKFVLEHPEVGRKSKLKKDFSITPEAYDQILQEQGGVCAICGQVETMILRGKVPNLAVDHNHACCPTKKSCGRCIRGLLCSNCNHGLGKFKDSPERLKAAIAYLERWPMKEGVDKP